MPDDNGYTTIRLDREGSLTWLVLDRPERLNAMSQVMLREIEQALDHLAADAATRVIAIRGEGRAFSSGYDIERAPAPAGDAAPGTAQPVVEAIGGHIDITEDFTRLDRNIQCFLKIWDHPKPVIAAVHGYCLAGATQLCVFTDITVVAEDAIIGLPSLPIGGGYITPIWTPLVGPKRAKQMSFVAGSKISGRTAEMWGWANYAVPAAELWDDVRRLAADIVKIPAEVIRMKKYSINRAAEIQGFRTIAPLGAETDALLHYSGAVDELRDSIRDLGLRAAIQQFNQRGT
jgi:enoyl-CoA hydratase